MAKLLFLPLLLALSACLTYTPELARRAQGGDAEAQFNLGMVHDGGMGVPRDWKEAVKWYRRAAEQGYAPAQNTLGSMYNRGLGVERNEAESLKWHRLAAEQGYPSGQYNVAYKYVHGGSVAPSKIHAHMWFSLAAKQGMRAARKEKKRMAKKMTAAEVREAEDLAGRCLARDYQNC